MTDVMTWLTAELDRAERVARAIPGGPWMWMGHNGPDANHMALEGPSGVPVLRSRTWKGAPSGLEWHPAFDAFLPDPGAVLRRVAADRQILAEHQPTRSGWARRADSWDPCELPGCLCAVEDEVPACGMCASGHAYDAVVEHWPCRTVLLLAEGWGWPGDPTVAS